MKSFFYLIFFIFFALSAQAAQTCNPTSIPASTPDSQLTDNGDGTISDIATGLMWKKCLEGGGGNVCTIYTGFFSWQQALEQPGVVNSAAGFAGFHDWRLPNIKELISIVEEQCSNPAVNLNRFPNPSSSNDWSDHVWSGSPSAANSSGAWSVDFRYGQSYSTYRLLLLKVRLVRSGQ